MADVSHEMHRIMTGMCLLIMVLCQCGPGMGTSPALSEEEDDELPALHSNPVSDEGFSFIATPASEANPSTHQRRPPRKPRDTTTVFSSNRDERKVSDTTRKSLDHAALKQSHYTIEKAVSLQHALIDRIAEENYEVFKEVIIDSVAGVIRQGLDQERKVKKKAAQAADLSESRDSQRNVSEYEKDKPSKPNADNHAKANADQYFVCRRPMFVMRLIGMITSGMLLTLCTRDVLHNIGFGPQGYVQLSWASRANAFIQANNIPLLPILFAHCQSVGMNGLKGFTLVFVFLMGAFVFYLLSGYITSVIESSNS